MDNEIMAEVLIVPTATAPYISPMTLQNSMRKQKLSIKLH